MTELFVTPHAIARYRERVEDVAPIEVHRRLNTEAFQAAVRFGCTFVKLGGGQRAVICEGSVVTVLPADVEPRYLHPARDRLYDRGGADA
ncbi:MAG: hypothetical protein AAFR88_09350 [Pseudomonadota bacterium]